MAERMGFPLMPWQRLVANVGGELDPETGLPAYRDVVVTVPRQSGKTTLILAWQIQRALGWGAPQKIVYSAQTGNDARKKLVEDWCPILEPRKAKLGIRRILKGMGNESVEFRNGSRIILMASGDDAGHGKTLHLGVKDEFFADTDGRRDQAMGPAMVTIADAQKLTMSTAGTDASVPLNQLVDRGRQAVLAGDRHGIAYFEWSADPAQDPNDPETWWGCMPALGISMTEDTVRHERNVTFAVQPGEFSRAYLNIPTKNDERLIPASSWALVVGPEHSPADPPTFAVDVNEERSAAAIVQVGGNRVVETLEHRAGLAWFVPRCAELRQKWGGRWVADGSPSAPIASFVPELQAAGIALDLVKASELPAACGAMYDAIADTTVHFRTHPSMDEAVAGAARRVVGDSWVFARRSAASDIAPLMAATVGLHVATKPQPEAGFVSLADFLDEE